MSYQTIVCLTMTLINLVPIDKNKSDKMFSVVVGADNVSLSLFYLAL